MDTEGLPLCVDLDGTLIRSDALVECALALVRRNPLFAFAFVPWLMAGKARLKREVAQRARLDVDALPFDTRIAALIHDAATDGREVVLCTGADRQIADRVAEHVGGFREVIASDGRRNLSGYAKAEVLIERYGDGRFDYVGNECSDLHVWRHARAAIVANAPASLAARVGTECEVLQVFPRAANSWKGWIRVLRLHQWLKNLVVFLPLLAAHLVLDGHAVGHAVAAFFIFGVCASSGYVLNDLLDLCADRRHPRKRERPFASGQLSLPAGIVVAPVLALIALAGAVVLSPPFALALLAYYILTLAYSFWLKRIVMLDVVLLAALYTLRIIAGTVVIGVGFSFWLLAFSMFLFFSLALVKRYAELRAMHDTGPAGVGRRGYTVDDQSLVQSLGTASGYIAVLVLALYINSTASELLYDRPRVLWLLCPLLLYWISRVWIVAHRNAMHDDPVIFALMDPVSRVLLVLAAAIVLGAV